MFCKYGILIFIFAENNHLVRQYIREGSGNPLQYSCLENPRDREAWWAAVYGVAQSQTRLKQLSSSSSSSKTVYMPTPCSLKHLCSIRALVPMSFFLSLSLSGYFFGAQTPSEFTFLPRPLRPSQEGCMCLHPIERAPEASMNRASPV